MTKYYLKQENHTSLKYNNSSPWATLSGITLTMCSRNERILPNSYTSTRQELYPNSQKNMPSTNASNKYEMRRVGLIKLVALSCAKAQYSNWEQMTLMMSHQAQKWATNPGRKRSHARCLAAVNDFIDVILSPRIHSSKFCQTATPWHDKNSIQTPKKNTKHKCKQQI